MSKKAGKQTVIFSLPPSLLATAIIGGPMEAAGNISVYFDRVLEDNLLDYDSFEQCEAAMLEWVVQKAAKKGAQTLDSIDYILAGDLLNQLMSAHFANRTLQRPFIGIYGACSSMVLTLAVGAMLLDGQFADQVIAAVSSHHDAAERQYRFPTELGVQRPPVAQWTVTGAGAVLLAAKAVEKRPNIKAATIGKIIDAGVQDPNAMGAAMAPAAVDTMLQHFRDLNLTPSDYDHIFTGDLGKIGKALVIDMMAEAGYDVKGRYEDCGCLIYTEEQDTHSGASGCASSAIVFGGPIYQELAAGRFKKVLIVGTGSLHSPTSYQQKETIPCIAHAIAVAGI
ncbi:MAG: stage V sporulation protein AD [Sporomusaceae bacterium]|nr:stage V sporulation protein AD [Sporomusaceae bacterium]